MLSVRGVLTLRIGISRDKANLVIWTPNWLYLLLLACSFSIGSMDIGFMEYCSVVDGMVENESEMEELLDIKKTKKDQQGRTS